MVLPPNFICRKKMEKMTNEQIQNEISKSQLKQSSDPNIERVSEQLMREDAILITDLTKTFTSHDGSKVHAV